MPTEILTVAPVVCIVLALGALFYFIRTPRVQNLILSGGATLVCERTD